MRQSNEPIVICLVMELPYSIENQGQKKGMRPKAGSGRIRERYWQLNHYEIVEYIFFYYKTQFKFYNYSVSAPTSTCQILSPEWRKLYIYIFFYALLGFLPRGALWFSDKAYENVQVCVWGLPRCWFFVLFFCFFFNFSQNGYKKRYKVLLF